MVVEFTLPRLLRPSACLKRYDTNLSALIPRIAILLVPLMQVGASPAWIFGFDVIDPWLYHGFFLNLKHHVTAFAGSYYGTRLAWILPGAIAHTLFGPILANAVLRLYICWIAAFSVFFLVRRFYGDRSAFVSSMLLCAYPDFLSAAGWDYVDGTGIAYCLLCAEELSAVAKAWPHRVAKHRALLAGAAFALAIHSNIVLLLFTPILALWLLARTWLRGLAIAIASGIGFLMMTAALGFISLALGSAFLFFVPSFSVAIHLSSGPNAWYARPAIWIPHAWWLVIPSAVTLISLGFLFKMLRASRPTSILRRDGLGRIADMLSLPLAFASFTVMQMSGSPLLQFSHYTSYLTIFTCVSTGALIGRRLQDLRRPWYACLAGACVLLPLLVGMELVSLLPSSVSTASVSFRSWPHATVIQLIFGFAAIVLVAEYMNRRLLSGVLAAAAVAVILLHLGHLRLNEAVGGALRRQSYLEIHRTAQELARLSQVGPLWFWYSFTPEGDQHYTAIASTYLWAARLVGRELPDTSDVRLNALRRGTYLAIMESQPAVSDQAIQGLAQMGVTVEFVKRLESLVGQNRYVVSLVQVTRSETRNTIYTPPPPETDLVPSLDLINYDAEALAANTFRVLYGVRKVDEQVLPSWVVRMTDRRDHCATNFLPVPAENSDYISAVEITVAEEGAQDLYGSVHMILQDQDYRTLYDSGTVYSGWRQAMVGIPAGTHAIRIAFLANDNGYIKFPSSVQVRAFSQKR